MHECYVTAPMVPITLGEARKALGDEVVIFGGVPSVILEEAVSEERFEEYMDETFAAVAPGDRFILGIAGNMMPTSLVSRVKKIGKMVQERGFYPIEA